MCGEQKKKGAMRKVKERVTKKMYDGQTALSHSRLAYINWCMFCREVLLGQKFSFL